MPEAVIIFVLQVPIEKLQEKIDQLHEERSAQLNRVQMAETEKNDAEGPMKTLLADLRLENGVALCKNKIFQHEKYVFKLSLIILHFRFCEL